MTNQHRATPEQWEYQERWASDDDDASCILELRCRVEALEVAQLEQAESNRFCTDAIVRRVEALEAAQQDKLDRLIAMDADPDPNDVIVDEGEQFHAVTARTNGWRPLDIETTYGSEPASDEPISMATAQQILRAPRMVEGTFEHGGETYRFKAKPERESAMAELRAASAEARPAGLAERDPECVANWPDCYEGGYDPSCCRFPKSCSCEVRRPLPGPDNSSAGLTSSPGSLVERVAGQIGMLAGFDNWMPEARAAIREVATFLEATQWQWCDSAAEVVAGLVAELRQEADR